MPDLDLDAIEVRIAAASPAPWGYNMSTITETGFVIHEAAEDGFLDDGELPKADLEFIAWAREDVPALIAEVRRLRDLIAEIDKIHQPEEYGGGSAEYADGVACIHCEYEWPCETHQRLHPEEAPDA